MSISIGPLMTAEIIHLRKDSRQREIENLQRQIRAKEAQIGDLAQDIRWLKLRLQDLGATSRD